MEVNQFLIPAGVLGTGSGQREPAKCECHRQWHEVLGEGDADPEKIHLFLLCKAGASLVSTDCWSVLPVPAALPL